MLKQRVITAVLSLLVLLATLFATNPIYWQLLMGLLVIAAFLEWLNLCEIKSLLMQLLGFGALFMFIALLYNNTLSNLALVTISMLLWAGLIVATFSDKPLFLMKKPVKVLIGIWLLSTAAWFLIQLQQLDSGYQFILLFFVTIWCADIGAYFIGRRFGKTKLAEKVSPGKTIEGLVGGLSLTLLVLIPLLIVFFDQFNLVILLPAMLLVAFVSVFGDLYESKLKRIAQIKDSSRILPGHGGVLDRIDSLLAGLPFFIAGLLLLRVI